MPMTQARRSSRKSNFSKKQPIKHGLREIVLIFFCFVGLYLLVSLMTYHGSDPGISHSSPVEEVQNKGGVAGALFADLFLYLFGYFAYFFPFMVGYVGWLIYQGRHHDILAEPKSLVVPGIGFVLTLSAGCGLAIVHFSAESVLLPTHAGGILGQWIGHGLVSIVSPLGATLILLALFFTGVTLLTGLSWLKLMDTLGYHTLLRWPSVRQFMSQQFLPWLLAYSKKGLQLMQHYFAIFFQQIKQGGKTAYTRWQTRRAEWRREREEEEYYISEAFDDDDERHYIDDSYDREPNSFQQSQIKKGRLSPLQPPSQYKTDTTLSEPPLLPALNLLESKHHFMRAPKVKRLSQQMVEAFATLPVEVAVHAVQPGPVLTCYEVEPITQINTNHLDELSEALAKVLKVEHVDIEENQPGLLEIDVPNLKRQPIYLKELLSGTEYQDNLSPLTVALGQDVTGQPVIVDLTRIPHILMAGNDVFEKTLAINTLLLSLLYKSPPEMVRFMLIDSSTEDLSMYLDLPHLLIPIITEMEQALPALQWCVQEMERRYRLMASLGVRNIENYNQAQQLQTEEPTDNPLEHEPETLFYIVVIINELGELMNRIGTQVEPFLTRLTQKARAAGIHIILATQHPTVNVITGLIKSNIPTRMAFKVTNQNESRTILGQTGAEMLLGQGDMLYMTAGTGMPVRVHGSMVSEKEVQKVVTDLKARAMPNYLNLEIEGS
jgi:S-DNA-T family DNA segregation ATPase FtsK/SpoIIIE